MTPIQAIQAATKNAANVLDMGDQIGAIEAGKLADWVVIDGDPLADIKVLQDRKRIHLLMKGGEFAI